MRTPGLAVLVALAAAAPAQALDFAPCRPIGYECARLAVPLDRTGSIPGTVSLLVSRVRASANPGNVAVVPLAGGPGQAATPLAPDFAQALAPALADRDLLVFDQRGTGGSDPLSCPALRDGRTGLAASLLCAAQLGPRRGLYRTVDSVADLEALRQATGYDKLVLYGVSYGTKLAEAYAAALPDRVEALVLDSVVPPDGPDPFRRASFAAVRPMLHDLCGTACRRFTASPGRDLGRLVARLRRHRLGGLVVDDRGRRVRARLSADGLFEVLLAGDLNPALRSELPGAVRSALRGDPTPILRLSALAQGLSIGDQAGEGIDEVAFRATTCEETALPWPREETSPSARLAAAVAAAKAIPPRAVAPFSRGTALDEGVVPTCLGWPAAFAAPPPSGPPPAVPTLVLAGGGDLRTPVADARRAVAGIAGAQVLVVPRTGHSVLGSDLTRCSADAVAAFFAGRPVAPCPDAPPTFAPVAPAPTRLSQVPPAAGLGGLAGRTLTALRLTVADLRLEAVGIGIAEGRRVSRIGGLRGGYAVRTASGLRLQRISYVPGVEVSGTIPTTGTAALAVAGPAAARGSVRITQAGHATGRLGGRPVAVSIAAALPRPPARQPGPLARLP